MLKNAYNILRNEVKMSKKRKKKNEEEKDCYVILPF